MIILFLLAILFPSTLWAGIIEDAAAALSPGQYSAVLAVNRDSNNPPSDQFTYVDSASYDSHAQKMYIVMGGNHTAAAEFMTWDRATNTISSIIDPIPKPPQWTLTNAVNFHAYDNFTSDYDGNIYIHLDDQLVSYAGYPGAPSTWTGPTEWMYSFKTLTWTGLPPNTARRALGNQSCCDAFKFFPERHGIYLAGNSKLWFLNTDTMTWSFVQNLTNFGSSFLFMQYNRISKTMVLIDGVNRTMYQIDQDGTVTAKNPFPYSAALLYGAGYNGNLIEDPSSGDYYLMTAPNDPNCYCSTSAYIYHTATDTWSTASGTLPTYVYPNRPTQSVGFAIPELNVTATLACGEFGSYCTPTMVLYKPSAPLTADADFNARRTATGVTNSIGFDTYGTTGSKAEMVCCSPGGGADANLRGNDNAGTPWTGHPTLDTTTKRSGLGSMKLTAAAGVAKGQYAQYICCGDGGLSDNMGHIFKNGEHLYFQIAIRIDPNYFLAEKDYWSQISKFFILHENCSTCSCGDKEVSTNVFSFSPDNFGSGYFVCGGQGWRTEVANSNFRTIAQGVPYRTEGGTYDCQYAIFTNCWTPPTNTWITIYEDFKTPTVWNDPVNGGGSSDATLDAYYSIDGLPYVRYEHIANIGPIFNCINGVPGPCASQGISNFTLPIYLTGGAVTGAPYDASFWYDELIVSTKPIAAPASTVPTSTPPPPTTAVSLRRRVM